MACGNGGDHRHMRFHHGDKRRDLTCVVHADFKHTISGVARHAGQGERHTPMIVVRGSRGMCAARRSQRHTQHLLGRGLAHTAGDGNVFLGGGPSFGLGLSGKDKSKDLESGGSGNETTTDIKFDGKKDATDNFEHLKAIDFGINLIGGYKLANGLFFNVGYSFGLSNISVETDGTAKNNGLSFKVGYLFDNGKKKAKK